MPAMLKIHPAFHSHLRLIISMLLIAGIVIALTPSSWEIVTRILAGWNVAVWAHLLQMTWLMLSADRGRVKAIAEREDNNAVVVLTLLSIAAALSLAAIVLELSAAKDSGGLKLPQYAFTAATVIGSWLLIGMLFTFHYARLYFHSPKDQRALRFPDTDLHPDYWDFLYFSFTIAVAAQTSDVVIASPAMRKAVLAQSVLSFLFNAAIIGMSINIAAGLIGS
jgi:uncharacterized membrane protein